jgi:hypothetical protein
LVVHSFWVMHMSFISVVIMASFFFAEVRVHLQRYKRSTWPWKLLLFMCFGSHVATSNWVVVWYCLSNGRSIVGRSCHIRFGLALKSSLTWLPTPKYQFDLTSLNVWSDIYFRLLQNILSQPFNNLTINIYKIIYNYTKWK